MQKAKNLNRFLEIINDALRSTIIYYAIYREEGSS